MGTNTLKKVNLVFITVVFFAMASVFSFAAEPSADKTTSMEVKKKVADAADSIKKYSVNERDEALKKAKTVLDDLDARIDGLESQLNEKWDQMDQLARKKAIATLTALRKQRNEISEWYGGLKHSSRNAWEDVKKGFLTSCQKLRDIFDKAKKEL